MPSSFRSQVRQASGWQRLLGWLILGLLAFGLSTSLVSCRQSAQPPGSADVVIGSKNFTEQLVLGELLAQTIEASTNLKVERRFNLGGTFICHQALVAGQLDAYVEYTGTAFTAILEQKPVTDPKEVYRQVQQAYQAKFQLALMPSLGFENTYAMVIRGEDARRFNLKTLSQVAQHTPQWRAGFGYEFIERVDGFPGLSKTYGLQFAQPPRIMDLGLMYRALVDRKVDMVAGNSTDGQIGRLGLVILQDDRHYFPPYEAVPIVRQATLQKYPALNDALKKLAGLLTAQEMQTLNYQVEGELQSPEQVVRAFLATRLK